MIGIAPPPANLLVDSSPAPAVTANATQEIDAANILEAVAALPPDSADKTLKLPAQKSTSTPPPAPKAAAKTEATPKKDAPKKDAPKKENGKVTAAQADASKPNSTRPVAEQADPFRAKPISALATTELQALVPRRSNKGFIIGGVVVAAAVVIGLAMRSGSSETPKPAPEATARVIAPAPTNDIPPPAEKDEPSGTPQVTQVAPAATPAKAEAPSKPAATTAAAIPADHRESVTAPKSPEPARVTAAPAPRPEPKSQPKVAAAPAPLPPASKTPQKGASGGIVRDNPF
ncbi:Low-complexity acidic protein [Labilithrix luteola]|uniref:Low-complexity acidic protein n=1 Tax=Labilithrix luteola TaxID=1391654 RepID=A0A0K1Q2Y0_9BACT|nr:Low-complexity acidic protein [Labilithrix luteola]